MSSSLLARRLALRALPRSRGFATEFNTEHVKQWQAKQASIEEHAARMSLFFVALGESS